MIITLRLICIATHYPFFSILSLPIVIHPPSLLTFFVSLPETNSKYVLVRFEAACTIHFHVPLSVV